MAHLPPQDYSGHLWKKSIVKYHRRFFRLKSGCLYWWSLHTDKRAASSSYKCIDLSMTPCEVIEVPDSLLQFRLRPREGIKWNLADRHRWAGTDHAFTFDVSGCGTARSKWIKCVGKHIAYGQASRLPRPLSSDDVPLRQAHVQIEKLLLEAMQSLCPVCHAPVMDGEHLSWKSCGCVFHTLCLQHCLKCSGNCAECREVLRQNPRASSLSKGWKNRNLLCTSNKARMLQQTPVEQALLLL